MDLQHGAYDSRPFGLYEVTKNQNYLAEARRQADAGIAKWADPKTGGFADDAKFNHLFSEALLEVYEATKDVKYLNAVRRDADFAWRYVRDPKAVFGTSGKKAIAAPTSAKP